MLTLFKLKGQLTAKRKGLISNLLSITNLSFELDDLPLFKFDNGNGPEDKTIYSSLYGLINELDIVRKPFKPNDSLYNTHEHTSHVVKEAKSIMSWRDSQILTLGTLRYEFYLILEEQLGQGIYYHNRTIENDYFILNFEIEKAVENAK